MSQKPCGSGFSLLGSTGGELANLSLTSPGLVRSVSDALSNIEARALLLELLFGSNEPLESLRSFILPGGTPGAALLHVCRTVCRRAERAAWRAHEEHGDTMNVVALTYLNRLSDLLFILARHANQELGDVLWVPGGER